MKELKQAIKREYLKCSQDPVHFMRKYCIIQHPTRGKIYFNLYDFQETTLTDLKDNRYNESINLKISTSCLLFYLNDCFNELITISFRINYLVS